MMYSHDARISIAGDFVVAALTGIRDKGINPCVLMDKAGICRAVISDQSIRVDREAFTRLILLIRESLQAEFLGRWRSQNVERNPRSALQQRKL